ncbi:MAG TPA: GNAT family N-acetyltransferase [Tepidisphaeraceae bacterium]|nr:GNAT family N-acetyltransferase [Tepidisphaeraceae bacterium]
MTDITKHTAGTASEDGAAGFRFIDAGLLIDRELELVIPERRWVEGILAACRHPLTAAVDVRFATTGRRELDRFLASAPGGHEPGDAESGRCPSYHFWMHLRPEYSPAVSMAGCISLRIGHTPDLELYYGHIGYHVYPPARGRHYAARSSRLLFDLARHHGIRPLWITTDPENLASRRTCELLGGALVDIVDVPRGHALYERGQRRKCRYRIDL